MIGKNTVFCRVSGLQRTLVHCPDNHIPDYKTIQVANRKTSPSGEVAVSSSPLSSWNTLFLNGIGFLSWFRRRMRRVQGMLALCRHPEAVQQAKNQLTCWLWKGLGVSHPGMICTLDLHLLVTRQRPNCGNKGPPCSQLPEKFPYTFIIT